MLRIKLDKAHDGLRILCLGAHCDDIEIGCGGALLSLQNRFDIAEIKWVVFASNPMREKETRAAAKAIISTDAKSNISVHAFRDAYLQERWAEIKDVFEAVASQFSPDIIFTHYGRDKHQDHRLISELTWNTFRNHMILEYEIPKYDGDLGQPNLFIPLSEREAEQKVDIILDSYKSQSDRHWFERDTFCALMRLRGLECGGEQKYAEGFYVKKAVI